MFNNENNEKDSHSGKDEQSSSTMSYTNALKKLQAIEQGEEKANATDKMKISLSSEEMANFDMLVDKN